MAAENRKKSIMEHLARSSDNLNFQVKRRNEAVTPPAPQSSPPPTVDTENSKKRKIMEHLARSTADSFNFSDDTQQRQQQIRDHLRITESI
ncbi:hypothetical protein [Gloeocapsa sp. PCC 73106]|uniref:hypothetical protein n=1 Tax=Gloeocapsa sp. PCC 73106 TaxID=102232 RepID=UPI0002ABD82A|nr:hypothetical protein [Gloeocapsa sp. PCC 73106]ELR98302.1 hypothetical protein GLO73106DRAFT_00021300 [Gloeocapsa sp. PCC 73106]